MRTLSAVSLAAVIAASGLLSGCASDLKKEIADVRAMAEKAQASADAANSKAGAAQGTADQALSTARDAKACCEANSEKVDRMFRKAMMK